MAAKLTKKRSSFRRHVEERKQQGLCVRCGGAAVPGTFKCAGCAEKNSKYLKEYFAKRHEAGLCRVCDKQRLPTRVFCDSCLIEWNAKTEARREARRAAGLCTRCTQPALRPSDFCRLHYLKKTARNHLGSTTKWTVLNDKWEEQNGRCAYTGVQLTLGVDAEIDHIVPRSRSGPDHEDNLVWISHTFNQIKRALTVLELYEQCSLFLARWPNLHPLISRAIGTSQPA